MLDFIINLVSKLYTVLLLPHGTHARIDVDLILRGVFGFYYVPIVLYVLLVGANVALQFVYVTLLPTVQDLPLLNFANQLQQQQQNNNNNPEIEGDGNSLVNSWKASLVDAMIASTSSVFTSSENPNTNNFAHENQQQEILRKKQLLDLVVTHFYFWISEVFTALIPHATFFFCLMAVMHKIVTASGEAAVDTMSYYRGLDYPLLFATVKVSVLAGWKRQLLTFVVGSTILYLAWRFAAGFIINVILTRPASVIAAVFANVIWCFLYLLLTFISAFSQHRRRENRRRQRKLAAAASAGGNTNGGTSSRSATDNDDEQETDGKNNKNKIQKDYSSLSSLPFWNELQWLQSRFGFDSTLSVAAAASVTTTRRSQSQELANFLASTSRQRQLSPPSNNNNGNSNTPVSLLSAHWASEWWKNHVNFIRHISLSFLLMFVVFWTLTDGPIAAFRFAVETLIALNIPNFCIYLTLKIVVAMIRGWYGVNWMMRHRQEGWVWVALLVSLPQLAVIVYTGSFVSSTTIPTVALAWAGIQVVARSVLLCREHDVSGHHIVWSTILTHYHHNLKKNENSSEKNSPVTEVEEENNHQKNNSKEQQRKKNDDEFDGTISPSIQDALYFHQFSAAGNNNINSKKQKLPPKLNLDDATARDGDAKEHPHQDELEEDDDESPIRRTKRRLAPAVAALLENAYECGSETTTETISLEMEADLINMKLFKRGLIMDLVREQQQEQEHEHQQTEKRIPIIATSLQLFPRLFLFQSSPSFSGPRFQFVRTVLRFLTGSFVGIFILLVVCLVAQESMEVFRPLPLKLNCLDHVKNKNNLDEFICNDLEIDHLVVKLRLQIKNENEGGNNNHDEEKDHQKKPKHKMHEFADVSAEGAGGPICDIEAVKSDHHHNNHGSVHLWELAWLSLLPYLANMESAKMFLTTVNRALETDWEILPFHNIQQQQQQPNEESGISNLNQQQHHHHHHNGLSRQARQPWRSFMRFRSASRNVTVVSIRGTDMTSVLDALQDVDMFLESFVYHTLSHLVPGLRMLPGQIVRDLIRLSSEAWPQDGISCIDRGCERDAAVRSERRYYDIVLRFLNNDAERFAKKFPTDKLILAGHSLAGSIAAIAAARFPKADRSFGFSSPGVELSMYKFGITSAEAVRRKAMTIVSDNDVVPMIGGQLGAQIPLACFDTVKERCHSMESIVNSIWQVCKDETLKKRFPKVKDLSLG